MAVLCEWRRLTRIVEIGVDRAEFATTFLHRIINCELYLAVDPWLPYEEMPFDREPDFQMACTRLERHARVAKIWRATSEQAANAILEMRKNKSSSLYSDPVNFVYIDASHRKEAVLRDLELWFPLISDNGIIAGHDWSMESGDHPGVQEAVVEFAEKNNLQVYYTPDSPSSFYIYKNGMPGPDWRRC